MSDTAAAEAVYTENFIAKVNKEGDYHEIIFRGEKSAHSFALRNARGASAIKDGVTYTLSIGEAQADETNETETEDQTEAQTLTGANLIDAETTVTGTKRRK